jgi:hypothetical protein
MEGEALVSACASELAPKRKRLEDGQGQRVFAEGRFRDLQRANRTSLFESAPPRPGGNF